MTSRHTDVAVVGGGIAGLAQAYAAACRGARVTLFERDERAVGASIRNFGLIWAIGQPPHLYERALRSREIWLDLLRRAGAWYAECGSLHLAYHRDEQDVLEEFLATGPAAAHGARMLTPAEVARRSSVARTDGLLAAMWSPTEVNVDPRQAIPAVTDVLAADFGVELVYGAAVRDIALPTVSTTAGDWTAQRVVVCSGNEFQQLYPQVFVDSGVRHCKLQMMRTMAQPAGWALGPVLCAGLTLLHYPAFAQCPSLERVRERFARERPEQLRHGIHVLVSQSATGEVSIGDSHAYAQTHDPFEHEAIDQLILDYFTTFASLPRPAIGHRWHGIYPSLPDGRSDLIAHPEPGVTLVNGLGGAGMTLSFGLADELVDAATTTATLHEATR